MRQLCNLVLARTKKDLAVGCLLRSYAIGSQYKCGHLMTLTVEPDNLIYDNWEVVEPYLVGNDEIKVGDMVYNIGWDIVGKVIDSKSFGMAYDIHWNGFEHSHSGELISKDVLQKVIVGPEKIGYLAHGYGKQPDDAFYDIIGYEDIGALINRGYCYVECEEVLKHRLSGRVLRQPREHIAKNLSGYDYVWLPKELKGKIIIHYEN